MTCGYEILNKGGEFLTSHDARLDSSYRYVSSSAVMDSRLSISFGTATNSSRTRLYHKRGPLPATEGNIPVRLPYMNKK